MLGLLEEFPVLFPEDTSHPGQVRIHRSSVQEIPRELEPRRTDRLRMEEEESAGGEEPCHGRGESFRSHESLTGARVLGRSTPLESTPDTPTGGLWSGKIGFLDGLLRSCEE